MRSGTGSSGSAASPQQTLSPEAASALKQSLTLARRRGHAQVTPLHVAATLLTSRTSSLLRRACLNSQPHPSHSHPLQCRALELCFNVALNRLPATPGPLLHSHQPTLSNALVAALKRAQAHQRRGCIEQQQQQQLQHPVIAVRVEIEQLVLSILDDPSVSRVMREAGFSSTAVKDKLEDCGGSNYSSVTSSVFYGTGGAIGTHHHHHHGGGGIYSNPSSPPGEHQLLLQNPSSSSSFFMQSADFFFSPYNNNKKAVVVPSSISLYDQDVRVVLDVMARGKRGRRNVVVVGDSSCMIEGIVGEVMGKVERGGPGVPEEMKGAHFIKFQFSSVPLRFMKREEVEMNVADLKRKVDRFVGTGGSVVIYTGDLRWTVDDDGGGGEEEEASSGAVDHLVAEMGKLVSWYNNNYTSNGSCSSRVWLMATASYQTYMKCQMKHPPLDVQWGLQAVNVPSGGGLGLSLNASGQDSRTTNRSQSQSQAVDKVSLFYNVKEEGKEQDALLKCCPECQSSYEKEAAARFKKSLSLLSINKNAEINGGSSALLPYWLKPQVGIETKDKDDLTQLKTKYNKLCQTLHQRTSHNLTSSSTIISNPCYLGRNYNHYPSSYSCWPNKNNTAISAGPETISFAPISSSVPRFRRQQSCHIEFSFSNNGKNQSPERNLDSLKGVDDKEVKITLALGNSVYNEGPTSDEKAALEKSLNDILQENVPWQSETSPLIVEALTGSKELDQDKCLLFQGNDFVGKRRLAIGIAKAMFGTSDLLFCMNMRKNTSTVSENREILEKALRDYEKLVVLVEDVDCADPEFVKFLVDGFGNGKLKAQDSAHAILVLTADGDFGYNKTKENIDYVSEMKLIVNRSAFGSGMPSIDHKRKVEWDSPIRCKSHRFTEMEEVSSNVVTNTIREFTSSNALDLNIKADEGEAREGKSPISSDLTREDTIVQRNSLKFLEKIKNSFVLKRSSDQEERARDMFLNKLKKSYEETTGDRNIGGFNVEEVLLEEVLQGSGLYLNSIFDQWLKDVFEASLRVVDSGQLRENVVVRLCLGGKGESCGKDGFMGTCLPKRIQVSFIG